MPNSYFQFKQFTIHQDKSAMKVTTDACLFGAWVAEKIKSQNLKVKSVLDIGSGTGLLSLMLAQKNRGVLVEAIEIDNASYQQANENISTTSWKNRITLIHADARAFSYNKKYDVIVSNPPFYENELKSSNAQRNLALHSNQLSLRDLFRVITSTLSTSGTFFILLPYKRHDEIKTVLKKHQLALKQITFLRQSIDHNYFRMILEGNLRTKDAIETEIQELSIWDNKQQYTKEFTELLKDYYLHLTNNS